MIIIKCNDLKATITNDQQQALATFISDCWMNFASSKPEGVMAAFGRFMSHPHSSRESDHSEIVYYLNAFGKAVSGAVRYVVLGRHTDLLTGACAILPLLAESLNTETPIQFEFNL
jgi:hypothetical protein